MTARRAGSRSRPARWWSPSITGGRPRCAFPARSRMLLRRCAMSSSASREFGGDADRIGVAGDSAGGNLAAAVAIACRDAGIKLAAQLLVYPVTNVVGGFPDDAENARFPSRAENADGYFLTRATMQWFCGHYLADTGDGADWRASPLRAKNLAGVAPAVVTHRLVRSAARRGRGVCGCAGQCGGGGKVSSGRGVDSRLLWFGRGVRGGEGRGAARAGGFSGDAGAGGVVATPR